MNKFVETGGEAGQTNKSAIAPPATRGRSLPFMDEACLRAGSTGIDRLQWIKKGWGGLGHHTLKKNAPLARRRKG